jgi:transposase
MMTTTNGNGHSNGDDKKSRRNRKLTDEQVEEIVAAFPRKPWRVDTVSRSRPFTAGST